MMSNDPVQTASARHFPPAPFPVETRIVTVVKDGDALSPEQRERLCKWLRANGIDPARVAHFPITVESRIRGAEDTNHVIGFTEYYLDEEGHKVINMKTLDGVMTYQRWVQQQVPIEPDPQWEGWDAYYESIRKAPEGKPGD